MSWYLNINPAVKPYNMMKTMHNFDNITSFGVGILVWLIKSWYMNISSDVSKIGEAVITAGLCGCAGMAGKELYVLIRKSIKEYFKNRRKR